MNYAKIQPNEYGITIAAYDGVYCVNKNQNQGIFATNNSLTSVSLASDLYTYMFCHTHPSGAGQLSSPSPSDATLLGKAYKGGSTNVYANVAFAADGSEYAVYVSDRTAFTNFCNNTANASFFTNTSDNSFQSGTNWATDYKSVYDNLINQGYSQTDANSYALTSVLDKYNTGIKIAVRNNHTDQFKEQKTVKITKNYQPQKCP